jgi:hypothetical protein
VRRGQIAAFFGGVVTDGGDETGAVNRMESKEQEKQEQ